VSKVNTIHISKKRKNSKGDKMGFYALVRDAMHKPKKNRFIELDLLRGFAITIMIILHLLWDLDYYGIYPLNNTIYQTSIIVQVMFFTLLGVCLTVTFKKYTKTTKTELYLHLIKRGLWIFLLGMIITIITLIFMPERPIFFGVLHCIGLCIILSIPFLRFKHWNIITANIMIAAGLILGSINYQNPTAFHLLIGLHPMDFWTHTIDYFPLFPWLGVSLLGVGLGNLLYNGSERKFNFPDVSKYIPIKALSWVGQHSLVIYLFHQPVLVGALSIFVVL
jgi:uncharacterized membrane protein